MTTAAMAGTTKKANDKWGRGTLFNLSFLVVFGCWPPRQRCHRCVRLTAVGHRGAQDQCPTLGLPEAKKKKDIKRAYKKMMADEKNDLMRKLAELDAEDTNDNKSMPPSPTPV